MSELAEVSRDPERDRRELTDIVAVYKEIDDLAKEDSGRASQVATLLTPYADARTPGWFDRLAQMSTRRLDEGLPDVHEALESMSRSAPGGRLRSRRLLAIAALSRADPDRFGPQGDSRDLVVAALRPLTPDDADDEIRLERGGNLLTLLAGGGVAADLQFRSLSDWRQLLTIARSRELIDEATAAQTSPPCHGSVDERAGDPAIVMQTSFSRPGATLDALRSFLDPENWPDCCALWVEMRRNNPGELPTCYTEVIALQSGWQLTTCLEFRRRNLDGGGVVLEYRLCEQPAHLVHSDGLVTVDTGSIVVWEAGGSLHVETTKRLRFTQPFDGPGMAMFLCALGYGAVGEDMAFSCAAEPGRQPTKGWVPDATAPDPQRGVAGAGGSGRRPLGPDEVKGLVDATVAATARCLQDVADTMTSAFAAANKGTYTADQFVGDVARLWTRVVSDMMPTPRRRGGDGGGSP